jgi:hypothetical protein
MNIIQYTIEPLFKKAVMNRGLEIKNFEVAAEFRVEALNNAIKVGEYFYKIKQILINAPNKGDVVTDMGTFKGWTEYANSLKDFKYDQINQYIFMHLHEQEFIELKLLSLDAEDIKSGASGHRKIAACEAVKWYLKLLKKDPTMRGKVTAADYQAQKSQLAAVGQTALANPGIVKLKYDVYQSMVEELNRLREVETELDSLRSEVIELKSKLGLFV